MESPLFGSLPLPEGTMSRNPSNAGAFATANWCESPTSTLGMSSPLGSTRSPDYVSYSARPAQPPNPIGVPVFPMNRHFSDPELARIVPFDIDSFEVELKDHRKYLLLIMRLKNVSSYPTSPPSALFPKRGGNNCFGRSGKRRCVQCRFWRIRVM